MFTHEFKKYNPPPQLPHKQTHTHVYKNCASSTGLIVFLVFVLLLHIHTHTHTHTHAHTHTTHTTLTRTQFCIHVSNWGVGALHNSGSRRNDISALQCVVMCCNVLHRVTLCCRVLRCVALCCSLLQCIGVRTRTKVISVMFCPTSMAPLCRKPG